MSEQESYERIAMYADSQYKRAEAVKKLTNLKLLFDIAERKSESSYLVSREAAGRLRELQMETVSVLDDQMSLVDIAKNDRSVDVRCAAVNKLVDQEILFIIAKTDNSEDVRHAAINQITDQRILADIAKEAETAEISVMAVEKLTDQNLLAEIIRNEKEYSYYDTYKVAVKKLVDQDILLYVMNNEDSFVIRKLAVKNITNQETLADIAMNDNNIHVRETAYEMVTNKSILGAICGTLEAHHKSHVWADIGGCRKRCSVCGKVAYNHKEVVVNEYNSPDGGGGYRDFKCTVCGHESRVASSHSENVQKGYV